ncbi:hypothetical protein NDU88_005975 [Pleurodeles waltl]|uniref:Uncharacterized protein n=1 Tax=Pleurodeles waltl TaxID=8319 RepID=A0AAV7MZJ6_PLEWA|nr:hypothetical protein NDU88_005975 [Pleurodeles waltl]
MEPCPGAAGTADRCNTAQRKQWCALTSCLAPARAGSARRGGAIVPRGPEHELGAQVAVARRARPGESAAEGA